MAETEFARAQRLWMENCGLKKQLAEAERERDAWIESAAAHSRDSDFYQGIVREIGEMFGEAARTSDDGSIQDSVVALKVPELVAGLQQDTKTLCRDMSTIDPEFWEPETREILVRLSLASSGERNERID